jgi:membrane fusion protein (multidrug efflux system)
MNISRDMMKLLMYAAIVSAAALIPGCSREQASDTTPAARVDVRTAVVRQGSIEETISATGTTIAQREAQLRSPITGALVHFKYYNGDKVSKGEIIAEVRTKESQAALQGAETMMHSATSPREKDEAERAVQLAQSTNTTVAVRAPFDGLLNSRSKNEMEFVSEGDQIASVVDPTSIIFLADVTSSRLSRIHEGQEARVRFSTKPGVTLEGRVHRIEPLVNPTDQTAHVQIVFDRPGTNLEGSLFGEVEIIVGRHERSLLLPLSALLRDDENNITTVMVVGSDSLAHRAIVNVGVKHDSIAEVSSPALTAGNFVIVEGHYGLADSTRVRVLP